MLIQKTLENAIWKLVDEFLQKPYAFFTEADAVARFHQILEKDVIIGQKVLTADGQEVSLIHQEYPTFFRFSDKNPVKRLHDPKARRGHYDTAILNPKFARVHDAATITNREVSKIRMARSVKPFIAVVEFKLDHRGWSKGRANGVINELGKLNLSNEAPLRYLVVLMRYRSPSKTAWDRNWPTVRKAASEKKKVLSIFAIQWLRRGKGLEVFCSRGWAARQWPSNVSVHSGLKSED